MFSCPWNQMLQVCPRHRMEIKLDIKLSLGHAKQERSEKPYTDKWEKTKQDIFKHQKEFMKHSEVPQSLLWNEFLGSLVEVTNYLTLQYTRGHIYNYPGSCVVHRPQTGHTRELLDTAGIQDLENDSEAWRGQARDKMQCWARGWAHCGWRERQKALLSQPGALQNHILCWFGRDSPTADRMSTRRIVAGVQLLGGERLLNGADGLEILKVVL